MDPVAESPSLPSTLDIQQIMGIIPHRYPFLLVDRVTELVSGEVIRGYKHVTVNEPFFNGHFPSKPLMPGVLQVEAMAQLSGILIHHLPNCRGKLGVFTGIEKSRFRRMVVPGDRLDLEARLVKFRYPLICRFEGRATVNGELAAEGEFTFALIDP